ncbi:MAG: TSUP family transporter, partial [Clostridiales bacterium]|nr:TSUP family transporter [Clostridiales bacterium]
MKVKNVLSSAGGAFVGLVNGLLGGGGGMLAVPLLQTAVKDNPRTAHATAIAVIAPVSLISSIIYFFGGFAPANLLLPVLLGVLAGGLIGAKLLALIPPRILSLAFAAFKVDAGTRMLYKWRSIFWSFGGLR